MNEAAIDRIILFYYIVGKQPYKYLFHLNVAWSVGRLTLCRLSK